MSNILKIFLLLFITNTLLISNTKVNLQLSWLHQFQFAGYYVAKEKGFYKDAGLDVEIKEYQFGLDISSILESGEIDFAVGRSSLLIDRSNGKDVVALTAIYQQSPLMLLVTHNSGIQTIEDLRNKSIMITGDAKDSASIIAMLGAEGLSLKDIKVQKHSFNLDDLITGKTDAMASYISNEPIQLNEKNIDYKVFHPKNYGFKFYDDILFTSSAFIKNNPQLTKDFYEATIKGWKYAFDNIAESSEIIYNKYNSQNKTKIQLVKEGEVLKKLVTDIEDNEIGCLDEGRLEKIVSVYKVLGLITNEFDLDDFIYEHNAHKLYKFNLTNNDILLGIVLVVFTFIFVVLVLYNTSINKKWLITNKDLQKELETTKKEISTQKDLIESQYNQLNSIINKSDEIIVLKDEHLNYIECNDYFANLFDKRKEEIIGKNDFYLFGSELAKTIREIDQKILQSNKNIISTEWIKFPNKDEKLLFKAHAYPFEYEKNKIGLLVFGTNITPKKLSEDEDTK